MGWGGDGGHTVGPEEANRGVRVRVRAAGMTDKQAIPQLCKDAYRLTK